MQSDTITGTLTIFCRFLTYFEHKFLIAPYKRFWLMAHESMVCPFFYGLYWMYPVISHKGRIFQESDFI